MDRKYLLGISPYLFLFSKAVSITFTFWKRPVLTERTKSNLKLEDYLLEDSFETLISDILLFLVSYHILFLTNIFKVRNTILGYATSKK